MSTSSLWTKKTVYTSLTFFSDTMLDVEGKEEDVGLDEFGEGGKGVVSKIREFSRDLSSELFGDKGEYVFDKVRLTLDQFSKNQERTLQSRNILLRMEWRELRQMTREIRDDLHELTYALGLE
ncbi:hypothetical protein Tco_0607029 [Tanacetum coccineum]